MYLRFCPLFELCFADDTEVFDEAMVMKCGVYRELCPVQAATVTATDGS